MQPNGTFGPILRQHDGARPRLSRRGKGGQHRQSFGRSRGGFSTKIYLKTDLDGNPLDFHLTGGEASGSTQFETSLDIGPDIRPRIAMTDKGYDSQANRAAARARGITPVIPRRENSKQRRRFFLKRLYKLRARIEETIGKLKRFKRVAPPWHPVPRCRALCRAPQGPLNEGALLYSTSSSTRRCRPERSYNGMPILVSPADRSMSPGPSIAARNRPDDRRRLSARSLVTIGSGAGMATSCWSWR
jgi:transposase